ncbi:hypothetical protein HGB13_00100 [bacterium]|nr:hypothetical protein [bacterium]
MEKLASFTAYYKANPDQRFWQALCNWAGVPFIYISHFNSTAFGEHQAKLIDTFYKE